MKLNKIYIEITNRCNLSCSFCSISHQEKREMSVESFTHIITSIQHLTKTVYLHVKGEPLFHSNIMALLAVCEKYQMRVNITTNATLLHNMYEQLIKFSCIKKMNISLHCEYKDENYFDHVFKSVNTLANHLPIVYRLWTLANHELDEASTHIVELLEKQYQFDETTKHNLLTNNNVQIANNIYVDKDNEFMWPSLNSSSTSNGYCYALKTHFAILVDGSVVPCCLDGEGVIKLGNIFTQNIDDIIKGERYQNLKKSFQDRKPCELLCQKCTFKLRFR